MGRPLRVQPGPEWPENDTGPLTWDDLDRVQAALLGVAPAWTAELNCASPDESTIVVLPPGANDLIGPAFVLHRTKGRVRLDQFQWDEYRKLGGFRTLEEALAALCARLLSLASRTRRDWGG